jgi:hypothetical protein
MTTPPTGGTDPLDIPPSPSTTTPIGDDSARDVGLTPPATSASTSTSTGSDDTSSSAADTAKKAADSASDHASQAASTAADEASKVASEAKDKAADLFSDLRSQLGEQSSSQLQGLSAKLGELADQVQELVSGADTSGPVVDAAQQLADRTRSVSSRLDSKEPLDLVEDVRAFARRRPGTFLVAAAAAGVVAGRLTRGARASTPKAETPSAAGSSGRTTGASTPQPAGQPTSTGAPVVAPPATGPSVGGLP